MMSSWASTISLAGAPATPTGGMIVMVLNSSIRGSAGEQRPPSTAGPPASRRQLAKQYRAAPASRSCSRCALGREARMDDGTIAGQCRRLDNLVVPLDGERLRRLVDQDLQKGVEVLGVETRGRGRDPACHVEMADDLH